MSGVGWRKIEIHTTSDGLYTTHSDEQLLKMRERISKVEEGGNSHAKHKIQGGHYAINR